MKTTLLSAFAALSLSCPVFGNLLVNGGFETGDLTGWTVWSAPWGNPATVEVQNSVVQQGSHALHVSGGLGSYGVYQTIDTTPGLSYRITAHWKGGSSQSQFWNEIQFFNDDGRTAYDQIDAPMNSSVLAKVDGWGMNPPSNFDWKDPFDGTQWFPSGLQTSTITATGNRIYVALKAGSVGSTEVWFDSFNVTAIPEPGSLALGSLMLFGGLASMAFRRKSLALPKIR